MSRGARQSCSYCGAKLKMRGAWVCEPCARTEWAPELKDLQNLRSPQ